MYTLHQVSLYLLLMEERYGQEVDLGLLWNINSSDMQAVRKVCRLFGW